MSGGTLVGYYYDRVGGLYSHGLVYDGTSWTPLDYPGALETEALGIDGNRVVGQYYDSSGRHGFIYDGSWTTLDYPGNVYTVATGVSGGTVVGYYYDPVGGLYRRGFVYDGKKWRRLDYPRALQTEPLGINGALNRG